MSPEIKNCIQGSTIFHQGFVLMLHKYTYVLPDLGTIYIRVGPNQKLRRHLTMGLEIVKLASQKGSHQKKNLKRT